MSSSLSVIQANRRAADTSWTGPTEALVKAIVAVLDTELPRDLMVDVMPDKIRDFDLGEREAAALVHYRGSKRAAPATNGLAAQDRTLNLDIHLLVRGLNGRLGALALTDLTTLALQGRTVAGLRINVVADGLNAENDGIWDYVVTITGTMPVVAQHHRHPQTDRTLP